MFGWACASSEPKAVEAPPGLTRKTPKSGSNLKKKFHSGKKEQYRIRPLRRQAVVERMTMTEPPQREDDARATIERRAKISVADSGGLA